MTEWLELHRGEAPLIVSLPHTGTDIPREIEATLVSPWLGRKDTDWWVHELYGFACGLGATVLRTAVSRTVIDVNRDPSGASLYPGQATTDLCPVTTFDGEPLYRSGCEPDPVQIAVRREQYFQPYHQALTGELDRLRARHGRVVLYDAHCIRSQIPRLFAGVLPNLNIGTHAGRACDPALLSAVQAACRHGEFTQVTDGRFKGGWTTRHYGQPERGVHAVQMELACSGYLDEPQQPSAGNWPPAFDAARAAPLRVVLGRVLRACLAFVEEPP